MFDVSQLSVDDILGQLVSVRQQSHEVRFMEGELAYYAKRMGVKVGVIAEYINSSKAYVHQIIKVYEAFPTEEDRVPFSELTYSHFKAAAYQDDPTYWMEQAADNAWSTRELNFAIKGKPVVDELRNTERLFGKVDRCFEAGGQQARYLLEKLTTLIWEVEPDDF